MSDSIVNKLTTGRLLARNTVINLVSQGIPLLVALFAIPFLIGGLGTERFGVLSLVWLTIIYFNVFDLGLGRALTKLIAEKIGSRQELELPALFWTALFLILILGAVGGVVLGLISPLLVYHVLKIPEALQPETLHAFYLLALSIPIIISTPSLQGVLMAHQRFGLINIVNIPMSVLTYFGPLLVLPFSRNLLPVVAVLVVGRLIGWLAYLRLCFYVVPALRRAIVVRQAVTGALLRFGSWMTAGGVVSGVMNNMDRFLIGAMVSATAVAYYATPHGMITRLWIVPASIIGVLFPAFSTSFVQDPNRTALIFGRGIKYIFLLLFPIILFVVTLANEALYLWLGAEFAQNGTRVLQLLAVGVLINSLAQVPYAQVQAVGRPDLMAKLYFVELPLFLVLAWWLTGSYGIEGAAVAWVARVGVDMLFLYGIARAVLPANAPSIRRMAFTLGAAVPVLAIAFVLDGLEIKVAFLLLTMAVFALATLFLILDSDERELVRQYRKKVSLFNNAKQKRKGAA